MLPVLPAITPIAEALAQHRRSLEQAAAEQSAARARLGLDPALPQWLERVHADVYCNGSATEARRDLERARAIAEASKKARTRRCTVAQGTTREDFERMCRGLKEDWGNDSSRTTPAMAQ